MQLILLLALVPILGVNGDGKLSFRVHVRCDTNTIWCVRILYFELDTWEDDLQRSRMVCFPPSTKHTSMQVDHDYQGDGPFNDYLEIKAGIRHNCTSNGIFRDILERLPEVHVREELVF